MATAAAIKAEKHREHIRDQWEETHCTACREIKGECCCETIVKRVEGVPIRNRHFSEADKLLAGTDPKKAALMRTALAGICAAEPGWGDKDRAEKASSSERRAA